MPNKNTIIELSKNIGKKALWTWTARGGSQLRFEVEIKDIEMFYGAPHYTIAPVAGSGQARVRNDLEIK